MRERQLSQTQRSKTRIRRMAFRLALLFAMLMPTLGTTAQNNNDGGAKQRTMTVKEALEEVKTRTGYSIWFNVKDVDIDRRVAVSFRGKTVNQLLDTILKGQPLTYEVSGKIIKIHRRNASGEAKQRAIGGTITDNATDEPLIGAQVRVKGSQKGVISDADGHYRINAAEGDVLVFSYIGYDTMQKKVGAGNTVNAAMAESVNTLDDVVVTGYQTISRERSAGAFGLVDGDVISSKIGLTGSVLQSMEGLTTGLSVNMSKGADKFTVRGITSINSNRSPLFVVDGMPLEEDQVESLLNGNDIESITLLKDATATSIWGSQAANGVVVITTRRGTGGKRLQVSYNGSFSYTGKPDYGYLNKMDNQMFMRNAQEMFDQYSSVYSYEDVQTSKSGLTDYSYPIVMPHERLMYQCLAGEITTAERDAGLSQLMSQDGRKSYEDNFMSDKLMTRHTVSLAGGNDRSNYYLSVGYVGQQDNYKGKSNRFLVNTKEEFKLTKWLKWDFTVNASYGSSKAKLSPWKDYSNDMLLSYTTPQCDLPYAVFYDSEGNKVDWSVYAISAEKRAEVEGLSGVDMSFYPTDDFNGSSNKTIDTNIRVNTGLTIDLPFGFKWESRYSYSRFHSKNEKFYPEGTWRVREEILASTPKNTLEPALPTSGGNFLLANSVVSDWTFRNQLTYNQEFNGGLHMLTALAGLEVREYKATIFNNFLRGYDMQTMQYTAYDEYNLNRVRNALLDNSINTFNQRHYSQTETMRRYFSLYANAAYTYMQRYTLNASIRMDQSNLFGSDPANQYKPIWSVGGAWKISEEAFLHDTEWLDRLTLRLTYGFAGNSPKPGQGGVYDILTATSSSFYETNGFSITTPANGKITWEKTRTWNAGFDIDVLRRRIGLSFNYYDKKTTDLISSMLLNPMSGWTSTTGNVGTMTNRGFELMVNSLNIKGKDFNWRTVLTLSHNSNEITKLDVETPYTAQTLATYSALNVEGYPVNSLFSYRYAGLNENGEPQAYDHEGDIVSGTESYSLGVEDVVYSGTTVPKFYGGLTNTFTYKNWELSFMFIYNFGNKMRNECETLNYGRPTMNLLKDFDNRWRKAGDEFTTDIPAWTPTKNASANYLLYYFSDRNVLDASYVKLRDLSLAYNVPAAFCRKLYTQSIQIKAQVGNLFYLAANNKGIDPEYYELDSYTDSRQEKCGPTYSIELKINF